MRVCVPVALRGPHSHLHSGVIVRTIFQSRVLHLGSLSLLGSRSFSPSAGMVSGVRTLFLLVRVESMDSYILRAASLLGVRTWCFSKRNVRARARRSVSRVAAAGHFGSLGWYRVCSRRLFGVGFGFTALAMVLPSPALADADGLRTAGAFFRGGTNCVVTHICH